MIPNNNVCVKSIVNQEDIQRDFKLFYANFVKIINQAKGQKEEKLRVECEHAISQYLLKYGVNLSEISSYEADYFGNVKLKGNTDAIYGDLILEYKQVGYLKTDSIIKKTIEEKKGRYLIPLSDEGYQDSVALIIFDGIKFIQITWSDEKEEWISKIDDFNEDSLYIWISLILGLKKKRLSPTTIQTEFSLEKNISKTTLFKFYKKLVEHSDNERINMLFHEWDTSFRYIYGGVLDDERIKKDFTQLAKLCFDKSIDLSVDKFLFALYTYYSVLMKLFACEITCHILKLYPASTLENLLHSDNLRRDLEYIEDGKYFKDLIHVNNFVETGFFSWYLEIWDEELEEAFIDLIRIINTYDIQSFFKSSNKTRDLLKNIYQNIIPNKIRHDLGEYYTPTWLVDFTLKASGFSGDIDEKVLDPACGSGGFLIETISQKITSNINTMNKGELRSAILKSVIGFDVNPIAVLTARTNYLIAISPLLESHMDEVITLPVFLADSIITPTLDREFSTSSYIISTTEGNFSLPKAVVESDDFHQILSMMDDAINGYYEPEEYVALLKKEYSELTEDIILELNQFYSKILDLHKINKNKIWVKLILNSFSPILYGDFDYVVGNPPWIKWDFLSPDYKNKLNNLYLEIYQLFKRKGYEATLGYAHDDISIMFTYVSMDKYLKEKGVCAFILKQTLYKSAAGEQFRSFTIMKGKNHEPIKCIAVHDFNSLNPFGKGQETSVALLKKGENTTYPVPYHVWDKTKSKKISDVDSWEKVSKGVSFLHQDAYPRDSNDTSEWVMVSHGEKRPPFIVKNANHYRARHGVVNDLNPVFIVDIVNVIKPTLINIENSATSRRSKVQKINVNIESETIYPLVEKVSRWGIPKYNCILVPHKHSDKDVLSDIKINTPLTYQYLLRFKEDLEKRKSKQLKHYYSLYGVGDYTFKKYKVMWNCMSFLPNFAVVGPHNLGFGEKVSLPDNPIGSISTDDLDEAHYLCAILNSKILTSYLERYSNKSKWGISITLVNSIPIPEYDKTNELHNELSRISKEAHHAYELDNISRISELEMEINRLVESLNIF